MDIFFRGMAKDSARVYKSFGSVCIEREHEETYRPVASNRAVNPPKGAGSEVQRSTGGLAISHKEM